MKKLFNRAVLLAIIISFFLTFTPLVYLTKQQSMALETPYQLPVLVISYIPLREDGRINTDITGPIGTEDLETLRNRINNLNTQIITSLIEAGRYHGYKDGGALASLSYFIFDNKEFLSAIPRSNNQIPWNPGIYRPDYFQILSDLNICNYVNNRGVKEVWMWGYHYGDIEPVESDMAMGTISKEYWNFNDYGDVSNSERINDLPICNKTYTLYNYNYGRGLGEALEDHTHQIEAILNYVDYDFFWNRFVKPYGETVGTNHCGWTHCPPNTKSHYDWRSEVDVFSDCEDWKPDGTGEIKSVDCHTWYGETCFYDGGVKFKIWWMQNIPGKNNNLIFEGKRLRNWWDFIGDFDLAIQSGKSLFYTISLSQGWNQITWPDVSGKKASDIPSECPIAVAKENFWFTPYVRNFGGVNFNFENGKTYYLKCNQAVTWQL